MSQVWPLQMGHADKLVLLALADTANDEGVCWPSVLGLCEKTCLSDRAVQQAVKRLTDCGHLSVTKRYKQTNVFTVHPRVYPERGSPEAASPETPSPEGKCISTPNDVHPLNPSKRTVSKSTTKKTKPPSKKATELPEDFRLDEEMCLFATQRLENPDVEAMFEEFRAHHSAKGTESKSWPASWRTWVLNAANKGFRYPRKNNSQILADGTAVRW